MTNIWLTSSNISHFSTNTNKSVAWATTPHEHLDIKQIIDTERSAARISSKVSKVHCRLAVTWRSVGFVSWWLWEHRLCQWWSSSMKMDEAWVVPWGHRQQIWVALPNLAESEWTWSDLVGLGDTCHWAIAWETFLSIRDMFGSCGTRPRSELCEVLQKSWVAPMLQSWDS